MDLSLINKEFGADLPENRLNHISTSQSWSKWELDWFNAERRFIFGCWS